MLSWVTAAWHHGAARRVLIFVCADAAFCVAELAVGGMRNSLALLADGFHHAFVVLALTISAWAMTLSSHPPSFEYSFGYDRYEVLAAFSSAIMLIFVCFFVVVNALERLYSPVIVNGDGILAFALASLAVNAAGLALLGRRLNARFGRFAGGGGPTRSLKGFFGARDLLGVSAADANVAAMYLQLVCEAGSSGGLVLSVLIGGSGSSADALVSIVISCVTLGAAIPLFRATGLMLLQTTPVGLKPQLDRARREASSVDGVLEITNEHYWTQSPGVIVGSANVRVRGDAVEQEVLQKVHRILSRYVTHLTVQVDKDPPLGWLAPTVLEQVNGVVPPESVSLGHSDDAAPEHDAGDSAHSHSHSHGHGHGHSHGHGHE